MPPGEFIPIIEQTALSRETTEWVLRAALAQIAAWRRRSIWITVSVNLSASNLDGPDLAVRLARMLREFGIPADVLELELTEGAVIREGHLAVDQLKEITASGVRLAIDDFGTGYSSLSYLERIPAQVVKIDRSFMHKLDVAEGKGTLVGGMVSLLHQLGYRVVAEGVETQATLDALLALGCDEIQGYLISRPLAAEAFQEWYAEQPVAGSAKDERSHAQQSPTSCRPRAAP